LNHGFSYIKGSKLRRIIYMITNQTFELVLNKLQEESRERDRTYSNKHKEAERETKTHQL